VRKDAEEGFAATRDGYLGTFRDLSDRLAMSVPYMNELPSISKGSYERAVTMFFVAVGLEFPSTRGL
jgi:hypothetical protein